MFKNLLPRLKRQYPVIILTLIISGIFIGHAAGYYQWRFVERLDYALYDVRMLLTMPGGTDDRVVIVDIDEKSLTEIGRWPWSRDRVARMVDELFEHYEVAMVAFDVVFPEPDESSGLRVLKALAGNEFDDVPAFRERVEDLEPQLNYDRVLAQSFQDRPVILGYYFQSFDVTGQASRTGSLPEPSFDSDIFRDKKVYVRSAGGYGGNLPMLHEAAMDAGHFTPWIDEDGVVRRVPMIYEFQGDYYESLSLATVRSLFGVEKTRPVFADPDVASRTGYPDLEALSLDFINIPVDKHVQALVPYRGFQGSFPYVSAADVIHGLVDKELLRDKIILVGTTAPGLFDLRTTPVQKQYPGVEIHANLITGIMDQNIKQAPAYTRGVEIIQLLLTGLFLAALIPLLSPLWATITSLLVLTATIAFNLYFWQAENLVLPLATILTMLLCIFLLNMSWGFFVERRSKKEIASTFGQYVPPELVDEMNFDPKSYTLDAENREMTVLFTDVRGFTSLSESLSPADLSELMNAYLTPMTRLIHDYRGTIDKYMGDAIMAFWGAPIENPDHARHALKTGLAMLELMHAIRDEFRERDWPEIRIGIGINTGNMSVGNMGSQFRMAYTVLGDAVNLGSRLEGLTKNYGVEIIVSESTRTGAEEYVYRELDVVRVKGKDEPIAIYEPIALADEIAESELEELQHYTQALQAYRKQDWQTAESLLQQLHEDDPEHILYSLYLERIAIFRESPPGPDWDGVYTHTSK